MQISPSKKSLVWGLSFSVSLIAIAKFLAQKPSPQFIKAERQPNKHKKNSYFLLLLLAQDDNSFLSGDRDYGN
ncbi:MAG TPA: hypothetical protein V6C71_01700 [Coleofasciculaceae cyanobacterium]|jgi:hypothetical protein